MLPTSRRQATSRMGMVGSTRMNRPKMLVPRMAPILANRRWIPWEEDLEEGEITSHTTPKNPKFPEVKCAE